MDQDDLKSETLARLYLKQGFPERAISIFEKLLTEDPQNLSLAQGLSDSRFAMAAKHGRTDSNTSKKLKMLEWMLAKLTGFIGPVDVRSVESDEPTSVVDPRERRLLILQNMLKRLMQDARLTRPS